MFCFAVCPLGEVAFDTDAVSLETELLFCSLAKVQTPGMDLNETLLVVDLNDPIDKSSSAAIKLDPVVPREILSQSINQLISVSMIACVSMSTCLKGVLPTHVVSTAIF